VVFKKTKGKRAAVKTKKKEGPATFKNQGAPRQATKAELQERGKKQKTGPPSAKGKELGASELSGAHFRRRGVR